MRHGPFIFLGLLCAFALSWLGMIATPQLQIGNQQPATVSPANIIYPSASPGFAALGREVYRANGCAYCHTQVVRQEGTELDVVMTNPGTNAATVVSVLRKLRNDLSPSEAEKLVNSAPTTVLRLPTKAVADLAQRDLSAAGAEVNVRVRPIGPDIARGWGTRLSVGADYLYASPLMLGSARIGPDLTNVGLRQPDPVWHLVHLYDPKLKVAGSIMPKYPFLFEKRAKGYRPAPDALPISGDEQIIPTREARALVAYLLSLRADLPLFEAPAPAPPRPAGGVGDTNAPAAGVTNAPAEAATNSPAPNQGGTP